MLPTSTRRPVGNVRFTVMSLTEAIDLVEGLRAPATEAAASPGIAVHFANAYNVALARKDHPYARLLARGDYVFSDGVPITWVGRRAYPDVAQDWTRVYGPDVMQGVLDRSTLGGPRHYLLGGTEETLAALQSRISTDYPGAEIVGAESPPFTPPTVPELVARDDRISASGATHVWVGLGTPKQDIEVRRLADSLPVAALAVGAAFDFLAGTKPQAPEWMQRNGVEWAFRLASEPRRLGRRYVWGNTVFLEEAARTLVSARQRRD